MNRKFLKSFSRTGRPKSIKLGTDYPWVKGIQLCSNKGPGPLQRGDNHKNVKLRWGHLKYFSPEPLCQFYPDLAKIILGGK
jgi:hypothetical protein